MTAKHLDTTTYPRHIPVLLQETYEYLVGMRESAKPIMHLDCNFGDAGHVEFFARQAVHTGVSITIHAVDADQYAIDRGQTFLKANAAIRNVPVTVHKGNFKDLDALLPEHIQFDSVLFDLGLSTYQLGPSMRGFSFKFDEALDMRFESNALDSKDGSEFTAGDIVNGWSADNIALILRNYADESRAWKITQAIVQSRESAPIQTSKQLADLIVKTVGENKKTGIHPATKTFQALRIAVNNEIQILQHVFEQVLPRLSPGGRVAVISYHSLEDMVIKKQFREWEEAGLGKRVNKKVIVPTLAEQKSNPRSRSAKLRIFQKEQI
jgi:16S rRNA (cytosine1402-N4)-methyltransferase